MTLLLPFAGLRVAMIDADLIAEREHATHPPAYHQQHRAGRLEAEHRQPRLALHTTPRKPRYGEQHRRSEVHERVFRRAFLSRALRWHRAEVIDRTGHGRRERSDHTHERELR